MTIAFESKRNDKCVISKQLHLHQSNCIFKLPTAPSSYQLHLQLILTEFRQTNIKWFTKGKTIHRRKTHGQELKIRVSRRIVKLSIEWKPESPKRSDDGFPLKLYFVVFEAVGYSKCVKYIGTVLCHTICALKE